MEVSLQNGVKRMKDCNENNWRRRRGREKERGAWREGEKEEEWIKHVWKSKPETWQTSLRKVNKINDSKGNHKQKQKTTYRMGKNICKWCGQQGTISKIYKQLIQLNNKNKQTIQSKNVQNT